MFRHVPSKIDKTELTTPGELAVWGPYNKYLIYMNSSP